MPKTLKQFLDSISEKDEETKASIVIELMRKEDPIILRIATDGRYDGLYDYKKTCYHIIAQGLNEILNTINSIPISEKHIFSTSILAAIIEFPLVKDRVWKDPAFPKSLTRMLNNANLKTGHILFRVLVGNLLPSTLFNNAPQTYYSKIYKSGLLELLIEPFNCRFEPAFMKYYRNLLLTLWNVCYFNKDCLLRCKELRIVDILEKSSHWVVSQKQFKDFFCVFRNRIYYLVNRDTMSKERLKQFEFEIEDMPHELIHLVEEEKRKHRVLCVICVNCSKDQLEEDGRFKKCSRCKVAKYCTKDCQVIHWKSKHKLVCTLNDSKENLC